MKTGILGAALIAFIGAATLPWLLAELGLAEFFDSHPTMPHFVVKTTLLTFSLVAMGLARRSWADFGFRRPVGFRYLPALFAGGALGGLATLFILLTPAAGMPNLRSFGLLGIIVSIWTYSSLTEELFVRGWIQSNLETGTGTAIRISGIFFGAMHLTLIPAGADWITVIVIVTATTLLGLVAAHLRQAHESLLPPIVAHVSFNVGGFVAGILLNFVTIVRTGAPITP